MTVEISAGRTTFFVGVSWWSTTTEGSEGSSPARFWGIFGVGNLANMVCRWPKIVGGEPYRSVLQQMGLQRDQATRDTALLSGAGHSTGSQGLTHTPANSGGLEANIPADGYSLTTKFPYNPDHLVIAERPRAKIIRGHCSGQSPD